MARGQDPAREQSAGKAGQTGRRRGFWRRLRRLLVGLVSAFLIGSFALVFLYRFVPPPITPLMVIRLIEGEGLRKDWVPYDALSENLARAVIASEDARFCQHDGVDWQAMREAWHRNQKGRRTLGASTITMQTAKNLFLWPARTYLRKGLEIWFALLIDFFWSKERILETYLNVVEWGHGIYGAEAAAHAYFGKSAKSLTVREAALLAAVLPNPRRWSPARPTGYISGRAGTIAARMGDAPDMQPVACRS